MQAKNQVKGLESCAKDMMTKLAQMAAAIATSAMTILDAGASIPWPPHPTQQLHIDRPVIDGPSLNGPSMPHYPVSPAFDAN